ncbi:MAG TPA: precorrin-8X methylmutase [Nitrospirae bacterium]|nr:precorrin-8X methylmutase [Nitrospirota bacterium]
MALERIEAAAGFKPEEIEKKSFDIISGEVDLSDLPEERLPVVKRVIHTTADFEFKRSLVFHDDAIKSGVAAIRAGKDILTDVEMVRTGINRKLLERWDGKVVCNIQNTEHRARSTDDNKTRAEAGIEEALKENNNIGIVAIGNAPTALYKTIEILNDSELRTANSELLVIGVPVGFVKAVESKVFLAGQGFPFITNISRKGGSTVAVAIVNALLKMAQTL